jgi:hypothetical protein
MRKAGPVIPKTPKNQVRKGFVNLIGGQRPWDVTGKVIIKKSGK